MSSFIQWPTLYGSAYFLPGTLVVVLLLALLLLLSSGRRSAAERARLAPEPFGEAVALAPPPLMEMAPIETAAVPSAKVVTQPAAMVTQPASPAAQLVVAPALTLVPPSTGPALVASAPADLVPVLAPIQPAPAEPADVDDLETAASGRRSRTARAAGDAPRVATIVRSDPMDAAIQDILNGWGDLSPEDMKRLELFRPERVTAGLAAVQLPKSSSSDTKMRLTRLRQLAGTLQQRAWAAPQATATAAGASVDAPAPETSPAVPAPVAPTAATPEASDVTPVEHPVYLFTGYADPPAPPAAPIVTAADPVLAAPQPEASAEPDRPAADWAEPRPLWEPDPGTTITEMPAPSYHEVEIDGNGNGKGAGEALAPPQPETKPAVKPSYTADDFFWDDEPVKALSRLLVKIDTAEQLLALPASERVDMVAFLPPAELVATFRATQDLELKKSVIDTLEHIGSPASLNALGNCFEDADSDVQVYALAAADRLLGVA